MSPEENSQQLIIRAITRETDRGAALLAASLLDEYLRKLISSFLLDSPISSKLFSGPTAPLASFSNRISLAYALGLIADDEFHDYHIVRQIRNKFAHDLNTELSFETEAIVHQLYSMKSAVIRFGERMSKKRAEFNTAILILSIRMHGRQIPAEKKRLTQGKWPAHEDLEFIPDSE